MKIIRTDANFEREPLLRPFGFKGGYTREIWQSVVKLTSEHEVPAIGLGIQGVLWSDARVFSSHSEAGGNALMFALTNRALKMIEGQHFSNPVELVDSILPELYQYGKILTANPELRQTFILNALVAVDNAAWLIYARENNIYNFDELLPEAYRPALAQRHTRLASIPLISYATPIAEIRSAADQGYFFMKIKIGQAGTQSEMLEKDQARIAEIHQAIGNLPTPYTQNGKIPYYFDANGRYEHKNTLERLIDFTRKIGAFDQIALIEEPFPENYEAEVGDLGVRIAADESAHTEIEALRRIEMGYGAMALKPIAKTLSVTLKVAQAAFTHNIPCFCADLTVTPILIDWNKNVAARLAPFPGLGLGLLETNGHQNYTRWEQLKATHPCAGADWLETRAGVFNLTPDFYEKSGGIFLPAAYFEKMFVK
jgi:L-alanine-DL-glutamate epimerase-like enolase superfamily enzyme